MNTRIGLVGSVESMLLRYRRSCAMNTRLAFLVGSLLLVSIGMPSALALSSVSSAVKGAVAAVTVPKTLCPYPTVKQFIVDDNERKEQWEDYAYQRMQEKLDEDVPTQDKKAAKLIAFYKGAKRFEDWEMLHIYLKRKGIDFESIRYDADAKCAVLKDMYGAANVSKTIGDDVFNVIAQTARQMDPDAHARFNTYNDALRGFWGTQLYIFKNVKALAFGDAPDWAKLNTFLKSSRIDFASMKADPRAISARLKGMYGSDVRSTIEKDALDVIAADYKNSEEGKGADVTNEVRGLYTFGTEDIKTFEGLRKIVFEPKQPAWEHIQAFFVAHGVNFDAAQRDPAKAFDIMASIWGSENISKTLTTEDVLNAVALAHKKVTGKDVLNQMHALWAGRVEKSSVAFAESKLNKDPSTLPADENWSNLTDLYERNEWEAIYAFLKRNRIDALSFLGDEATCKAACEKIKTWYGKYAKRALGRDFFDVAAEVYINYTPQGEKKTYADSKIKGLIRGRFN